ncbi:peptide chain release factor 2 [Candidatus Annandia pinicola]|uniref:peptide chain release factor 2 n=1 Tax=Candidatus Annandia pinicola TaxID=1345117 RepID=UPI0038CBF69C
MLEIYYTKNNLKKYINYYKLIKNIFKYKIKNKYLKNIKSTFNNIKIYNNFKEINDIKKNKKKLKFIIKSINKIYHNINKVKYLYKIYKINKNKLYDIKLSSILKKIKFKIKKIEFNCVFLNKYDILNCYLNLQSGVGGLDSQDFSSMLMKMYIKWSINQGFKINILETSYGDLIGIKSTTINIIGKYAFGLLKNENGIHRLIRKSPFNANKKRHTSFSSVFVYPETINSNNINLNIKDLKIEVYKSSGSGGQHVNKTESAVRITHIPTGIKTQCQSYRSQHQNKSIAIKKIINKLHQININKKKIKNYKIKIGWGNQIRSYILDNSLIKDLRTGIEKNNVNSILNGNGLNYFIKSNLKL